MTYETDLIRNVLTVILQWNIILELLLVFTKDNCILPLC